MPNIRKISVFKRETSAKSAANAKMQKNAKKQHLINQQQWITSKQKINLKTLSEGQRIVANALKCASKVYSLQSSSSMKAVDEKEDFTLRFSAEIIAKRPASLHLTATKGLGIEILEMAMVGESLDIMLPRKKTLYRGYISDLDANGISFNPTEIVEQLLFPVDSFLRYDWKVVANNEEEIIVEQVLPNKEKTILIIEPKTFNLIERKELNPLGQCWLNVSFGKYRQLEGTDSNCEFPHKFKIKFPIDKRLLIIVLRGTVANPVIKPSDFWMMVPDSGIKVKPLKKDGKITATNAMRSELEKTEDPHQ
jgi:hypothetical protein